MAQMDTRIGDRSAAARYLGLASGLAAFVITLALWVYWAVFLGNLPPRATPWVEPTVSIGPTLGLAPALFINCGLILLFGLQHSLMSRVGFKAWLTRTVHPDLQRSIYVHAANLTFFLLLAFWQPIPVVLWDLGDGLAEDAVWLIFVAGWTLLIASLISINPYELLGLRQAWFWFQSRPHEPLPLEMRWPYSMVRHPLYLGVLVVVWAAPYMTLGHLLFAVGFSLYIAIGTWFEERDLIKASGGSYREYMRAVPALLPRLFRHRSGGKD